MLSPDINNVLRRLTKYANYNHEEYVDLLGNPIHNFYFPNGADVAHLLDSNHKPEITTFETIVLLPSLSEVRGQNPSDFPFVINEIRGNRTWLNTISDIARSKESYDPLRGTYNRIMYLYTMTQTMSRMLEVRSKSPKFTEEYLLPVRQAGENIARKFSLPFTFQPAIEAERLRFKHYPDLLVVGINLPSDINIPPDSTISLIEGFLASGSTVAGSIFAFHNRGIKVRAVNCYAVVACPAGGEYLSQLRELVGDEGQDFGAFVGGELNNDWYVVYSKNDPLLNRYPGVAKPGDQVGGDAGVLTTIDLPSN